MTSEAQNNLILAMYHNAVAKHYIDQTRHLTKSTTKDFLNTLFARLKANEADMKARLSSSPESLKMFETEIEKSDIMQYDHVVLTMLGMNDAQKELVEKVVEGIRKGELIEFNEPVNSY
jgi:hypothetical protein